ncbi:MAG: PAS domain S-box protein [Chromatiales bacterium]|jgi:PAS domain S-box-containing protein
MSSPPKDPSTLTSEQLLERMGKHGPAASTAELCRLLQACTGALRAEMDQSARLLDAVDTVIVGLDTQGRVTLVNRKGCELLGFQEGELLGRSWFETCLPQPEGLGTVYPAFQKIMAGRLADVDYFENEVLTRSGQRRMMAWRNSYMRDAAGAIIGTLSAGEDITARKQAEDALRESEARLDHLLTSSPAVIYSARVDGDYGATFVSDNVTVQTGYLPRMFTENPGFWLEHIHPEDRTRVLQELPQVFASGVYRHEYRFLHRDGSYRWMCDEIRLHRDADGRPTELIGSWRDVTQRKLAEERSARLLKENRRLMQRLFHLQERERKHLARELHDEFGQWLSAAQANAQSLIGLAPERTEDLRASAGAIIHCISEVQKGVRRMICDLRPAVLDQLGLEDSLRDLVSSWCGHHPHITCRLLLSGALNQLGETIDITVYRIIQEALTNISKHANARDVTIRLGPRVVQCDAKTLYLTIEDDGGGLVPASGGGGMGLLGMRERVRAAGGSFELIDHPAEGVSIEVKLPVPPVTDPEVER